jgi:hypothetical protein
VSGRTGLRSLPGDPETIQEAFKPNEEPDDPNSFLGYELATEPYGAPPGEGRPVGPPGRTTVY